MKSIKNICFNYIGKILNIMIFWNEKSKKKEILKELIHKYNYFLIKLFIKLKFKIFHLSNNKFYFFNLIIF